MSDPVFITSDFSSGEFQQASEVVDSLLAFHATAASSGSSASPSPVGRPSTANSESPFSEGATITVDGSEGRHAVTVKRLQVGERITLADGYGNSATCTISEINSKTCFSARVDSVFPPVVRRPPVLVVQALPKSDRSELAIDLATQTGADAFVPWAASRCIAKWTGPKAVKGCQKWLDAAIASAKQSRRSDIPPISQVASTDDVAALVTQVCQSEGVALVLHEQTDSTVSVMSIQSRIADARVIVLIVGPEGGLSNEEVETLVSAGGTPVILGPEVLRTASAASVALGALGVLTSRWDDGSSCASG